MPHTPVADLLAGWEPHEHVDLRLLAVDHATASFDLATHPAYREQGRATAAMWDLVMLADECGVALAILAEPDHGSASAMAGWYSRFGFVATGPERSGVIPMVRSCDRP